MKTSFILGTAQLGQVYGVTNPQSMLTESEVSELLKVAQSSGVQKFDTAMSYGKASERLGQAVRAGVLSEPKFISKIKFPSEIDLKRWTVRFVQQELNRLSCHRLEGLLLHSPSDFARPECWRVLRFLKDEGKVKKIGISVYDPSEVLNFPFASELNLLQVPYHVLDHRWDEPSWRSVLCKENPPEIHVRSVFLQGLLLSKPQKWPEELKTSASPVDLFMQRMTDIFECPPLELCLNFVAAKPWVAGLVVGAYSADQLQETIQAFHPTRFDGKNIAEIERARPYLENRVLDPRLWS